MRVLTTDVITIDHESCLANDLVNQNKRSDKALLNKLSSHSLASFSLGVSAVELENRTGKEVEVHG